MIFRIFDNMIFLFPALAQNYRKGYRSRQMMNLFTRLSYEDLYNPDYAVPSLSTNVMIGDASKVITGKGSSRQGKSKGSRGSKTKSRASR